MAGRHGDMPCLTIKLTSAGNIKASAGRLYWIVIVNEGSSSDTLILNDDNDGTDDEIMPIRTPGKGTLILNFDPCIGCTTGIRIGTMASQLTAVAGYI